MLERCWRVIIRPFLELTPFIYPNGGFFSRLGIIW